MHYLLYGHGGSYNHGAEAIVRCTIALLREISPSCHIALSTHFPEQDEEFKLPVDEFVARNMQGKTSVEVYKSAIDKITPDTICIHTGGDNYCYNNWQRYAEIHYAAIKRDAISILWGCSIDPDVINGEMLDALRTHNLIISRESITYNALINHGLTNIVKIPDIAFGLEPKHTDFDLDNFVVLNLSPLVCRKNPILTEAYQSIMDYILRKTDYNIALLPHVLMPVDNDYDVLRDLATYDLCRVKLVSDKLSASAYKHIISRSKLCIAARTHVTIAAYSSYVPTLAVGYSVKAAGIAQDLGMSKYVLGLDDIKSSDDLAPIFKSLIVESESLRKKLKDSVPTSKYVKTLYLNELNKWISN